MGTCLSNSQTINSVEMVRILVFLSLLPCLNFVQIPSRKLMNDLLLNYNRNVRPVANHLQTLNVTLFATLRNLIDLDEAKEQVIFTQWVSYQWIDVSLKWNPKNYDGITNTNIHLENIWRPDILIIEQLSIEYPIPMSNVIAVVQHDGSLEVGWPEIVTLHCSMDVTAFPYDKQTCTTTTTSWALYGDQLHCMPRDGPVDPMSNFVANPEWDLTNVTAMTEDAYYANISYYNILNTYEFTRKPMYYLITLVAPSFAITTMCLLGLFSPSSADQSREEKVTIGLTGLLTISVILLMVSETMPKSSSFPRLGTFIIVEMLITFIATLVQVGMMYLQSMGAFRHNVPKWLLRVTILFRHDNYIDTPKIIATKKETASRKQDVKHSDENVNILRKLETSMITMSQCLKEITDYITTIDRDGCRLEQWAGVCFRLDLGCLIIFQAINIAILVYYAM